MFLCIDSYDKRFYIELWRMLENLLLLCKASSQKKKKKKKNTFWKLSKAQYAISKESTKAVMKSSHALTSLFDSLKEADVIK